MSRRTARLILAALAASVILAGCLVRVDGHNGSILQGPLEHQHLLLLEFADLLLVLASIFGIIAGIVAFSFALHALLSAAFGKDNT